MNNSTAIGERLWLIPLMSMLALAILWQGTAYVVSQPRTMPHLTTVIAVMVDEAVQGELWYHLGMTLWRVVCAFTIAMSVGIAMGLWMGRRLLADAIGQPWLVFFLNLPALVVIVLAYIWIGLNEVAAITAVAINKIPNVTTTLREGAKAIDPQLQDMAKSFGVSRYRSLRHVMLPQLYPYVMAAARTGLALIWKIVLVVELLGRSNGVGFQISLNFQLFNVAGILAYALAFIIIVQLIEWSVIQPAERRLNAWRR